MKFKARKRPLVIVDAIQFKGTAHRQEIFDWANGGVEAREDIAKLTKKAKPSDWIIRGQEYGFYLCKNKVFEERYEPIDEGDLKPGDMIEL